MVSIAIAHITKNTAKNKADYKSEIPNMNKSKLSIEWYKLKLNVAIKAKTRQNFKPLKATWSIELFISLNFENIIFITFPPNYIKLNIYKILKFESILIK